MAPLPQLTKHDIQNLALNNGFSLKIQANGQNDLNPYVYDFARAVIEKAFTDLLLSGPDLQPKLKHYLDGLSNSEPVSSVPGIHPNEKLIDFAKRMQDERDMAQKALVNALQILPKPNKIEHAPKEQPDTGVKNTQTQSVSDFIDILPMKDEFNLRAKDLADNPLLQWSLSGVFSVAKPKEYDRATQLRARATMLLIDTMSEYYIAMNPTLLPIRAMPIIDRLNILKGLSVSMPTLHMPWLTLSMVKVLPDIQRLCSDGGLTPSNTAFDAEILNMNSEIPWVTLEKKLLTNIGRWLVSVREHVHTHLGIIIFHDMMLKFLRGYLQRDIDLHRDTCRFNQAAVNEFIAHFKG